MRQALVQVKKNVDSKSIFLRQTNRLALGYAVVLVGSVSLCFYEKVTFSITGLTIAAFAGGAIIGVAMARIFYDKIYEHVPPEFPDDLLR